MTRVSVTMNPRTRLFFFGGSEMDRPFIEAIAARLGLPFEIRRGGILYRALALMPGLAGSTRIQRIAQILSPWIEAIEISLVTRRGDLVLIRNIRTAIAYLTACDPLRPGGPQIVLTWFTMKRRPPAYWLGIYRRALLRAFRVFVFTPKERVTYASWFEVSPERFTLAVLEAPAIPQLSEGAYSKRFDVIMTGETNRDWESFAAVCEQLPQISFAAILPADQAGRLPCLPNLRTYKRLPFAEYCQLITQSIIQLILVRDHGVAVGQRDFLLAGQLGVPVIATAVESMRIYDPTGACTIFVEPADVKSICDAIDRLLRDSDLRAQFTRAMKQRINESHSLVQVSSQWAANLVAGDENRE